MHARQAHAASASPLTTRAIALTMAALCAESNFAVSSQSKEEHLVHSQVCCIDTARQPFFPALAPCSILMSAIASCKLMDMAGGKTLSVGHDRTILASKGGSFGTLSGLRLSSNDKCCCRHRTSTSSHIRWGGGVFARSLH